MTKARLSRLSDSLQASGFDALALNPGQTLTYLTGLRYYIFERPIVLIIKPGETSALVLPELEVSKAEASEIPVKCFPYGENPETWHKAFQSACSYLNLDGKTVAVEPHQLRVLELRYLENAIPAAKFVSADPVLNSLRIQKDEQEIAYMKKAVIIAQNALQAMKPLVKIGMSEMELAAEFSHQLLKAGTDPSFSFGSIVASGPNSANPHASLSERIIQPGDLLIFDFGANHHGYHSDITRTFAIGEVNEEFKKIAKIVAEANAAAQATARPGIPARSVDEAARNVITKAGYGEYFIHRTGHGLGMEVHEPPYIHSGNNDLLKPGMSFTIEPGIYIPGRGGVRIEDDAVITGNGMISLSDFPRELVVLG